MSNRAFSALPTPEPFTGSARCVRKSGPLMRFEYYMLYIYAMDHVLYILHYNMQFIFIIYLILCAISYVRLICIYINC